MVEKYKKYLWVSLLLLSLLSGSRYFNNLDSRMLDMASHFPVQYAVIAFIILMMCIWGKKSSLAVLAGGLFIINAGTLVYLDESIHAAAIPGKTFKVYSANISMDNEDISLLRDELQEMDPDIVLLLEITPEHINELRLLIRRFPFSIERSPIGTFGLGLVLLSNFPVLDYHIEQLSVVGNVMVTATLKINENKIMFYGTHSQNPAYVQNFPERKEQFLELSSQVNRATIPVIVAGDLNLTPYSPIYRELINISGLKDSRDGFGWQPSWPTYMPLVWLPIDHILVSPDIQVHNRATGSFIGSDHYPVFAELSLRLR